MQRQSRQSAGQQVQNFPDGEWDRVWIGADIATMTAGAEPYGSIKGAALAVKGDRIAWIGEAGAGGGRAAAGGGLGQGGGGLWVMPGHIHCPPHLVFCGAPGAGSGERRCWCPSPARRP